MTTKDNGWRERFGKKVFKSLVMEDGFIRSIDTPMLVDFIEQERIRAKIEAFKELEYTQTSYSVALKIADRLLELNQQLNTLLIK